MNYKVILLSMFLCMGPAQSLAQTHLHITTGFTPPVSDFYNSVLKEVDKRLQDISISFEVLPAERSLILANEGVTDGDCCRIPEVLANSYRNLQAVEASFFTARFSAFTKRKGPVIKSFSDLKPFTVGAVEGWKISVIKVKEVKPAEVYIVTTPEQMFEMIAQDRLDYGVTGYLSGLQTISKLKLGEIHVIEPPLINKPLYLMLNNKHKKLIPVINQVIEQMKSDGTVDRLYAELLESLK